MSLTAYLGCDIHDGRALHAGRALMIEDGVVAGIVAEAEVPPGAEVQRFDGGVIFPGFVDLQVNGGGGVMFNEATDVAGLSTMAAALRRTGTAAFLPTLITDTAERMAAAVAAVEAAMRAGVPGIAGLHLEGPHLSVARKGAHDPALIRPMTGTDRDFLLDAAARVPKLMVTVAPENTPLPFITDLAQAGILVSVGHTDCSYAKARAAFDAGARAATHLFNAMSQLGSREPGLVGAALDDGRVSAGLIADAIHVHPATMRAALAAKRGPGRIFLVTDAMATLGSEMDRFTLNGRTVLRADGRLTLEDGTLAGADLAFARATGVMTTDVGLPRETALEMATGLPASLIAPDCPHGRFAEGVAAPVFHLKDGRVTEYTVRA